MPASNTHPARMPSWEITDPTTVVDDATSGPAPQSAHSSRWRSAATRTSSAVRRHPFRAVAASIAVGALGVGGAATMAAWVDQVQVQVGVASGTLDLTIGGHQGTPQDPYVIDLQDVLFKPGDPAVVETMPLDNPGTLPAVVTVHMAGQGAAFLGSQLDATLTITRPSATPITVTGKALALTTATFTMPAGSSYAVELRLSLPSSTSNSWQGTSDTLTLTADAVQE